jgi:glycosyltransferase involved in cell wall biosynthesis
MHGQGPTLDGRPVRSMHAVARAVRKASRIIRRQGYDSDITAGFTEAFRRVRPDAVLAEYGWRAVDVDAACQKSGIPLIAHFHGYDASEHAYLEKMRAGRYQSMFRNAAAIVAVSQAMRSRLISLGCSPEKVHWSPYGVDCAAFDGGTPEQTPPIFLAVGRFTEKKAPHLTIEAFARVHHQCPAARLRMIGFGPLQERCEKLVQELGIAAAVTFLGVCPPSVVQHEMKQARCFVQHSVRAPNGDSEGTPVAVLEAGAAGLPVVSTLHEGIPDVVLDNETGFLVSEGDVAAMAERMLLIAHDATLAVRLGRQAQARIRDHFTMEKSIRRLWEIIEGAIRSDLRVHQ